MIAFFQPSPFRNRLLLLIVDLIGLVGMYSLAHRLRIGSWIALDSAQLWVLVMIAMITMYIMDVYRTEEPETRSRLPLSTFTAVIAVTIASMVFVYTIGITSFTPIFGRGVLPVAMAGFAIWAPLWRWLLTHWQEKSINVLQWLVVSDRETYDLFSRDCKQKFSDMKLHWVDADGIDTDGMDDEGSEPSILSDINVRTPHRHGVIFSIHSQLSPQLASRLMSLRFTGMPVLTLTEFYEQYWLKVPVLHLKDGWFVQTRGFNLVHDHIGLRVKRMLDLLISVIGGVIALPVLLLIGLIIPLDSRGKALYRQTRVGLNGRHFVLYKFRTMVVDAEANGAQWASEKDSRVTRIGDFLRTSRLDELPQLWNLFKGEMSLIGPRPERPEFVSKLDQEIPYYDLRHLVPPGITGWAQVMYSYGASTTDARKKLEYDLYYIKNHSLQLDLAIMIKTVIVIFRRKGR